MNFLVKATVVAVALGASAAASADTFDFSYLFADGQDVTGSFTGTSTDGGQSVTNASNFQVSLNDIAFTGGASSQLILNTWNTSTESFNSASSPTTIFKNGALNNFAISDVDASINTSPDYEFAYLNDPNPNTGSSVVAANFLQSDSFSVGSTQLAIDQPGVASSWRLTDVSAVPIPAALPLLMSGLGLLGFARRRRAA
jgi:hypothetical protein